MFGFIHLCMPPFLEQVIQTETLFGRLLEIHVQQGQLVPSL
jgi:hypothetical protein